MAEGVTADLSSFAVLPDVINLLGFFSLFSNVKKRSWIFFLMLLGKIGTPKFYFRFHSPLYHISKNPRNVEQVQCCFTCVSWAHLTYTLYIFIQFKTQNLKCTLGCTSVEPETLLEFDWFNVYKHFCYYWPP